MRLEIYYTDDQLKDLQQFLKSDKVHILGVDRTFNLGAVFVTNFVYKNTKVTSKESGDHPIFVGSLFLHWDGSFLSYHTFFSHVKARIQETVTNIDLRIGSDDENGLTKALDSVFPEATRLLCTKHMKDNVFEYLKNSLGSTDKQSRTLFQNFSKATDLLQQKTVSNLSPSQKILSQRILNLPDILILD